MNATDAANFGRHAWSLGDATEVTPEALESWVTARLDGAPGEPGPPAEGRGANACGYLASL